MNNLQEDYIEKIKEISINPLKCSNHFFNDKLNAYIPGRRYNLIRYKLKDYLTVPSNMVVFELDSKTYSTNYKLTKKIINALKNKGVPFFIFASGGKGLHIEVWLKKPEWKDEKQKELFKLALEYGLSFKHIRFWFWNKILNEANTDKKIRGKGNVIDSSCINFDDLNNKTKLLRVCGGRKIKVDAITRDENINYKSYIPDINFNSKKVIIDEFANVKYPQELKSYTLDVYEFTEFLSDYIKFSKDNKIEKFENIDLSKNKGYVGLDSVQQIIEGLPTGKRNAGAQVLAIAMRLDNIVIEKQHIIIQKYVDNCSQIGDAFIFEEALGWINWMQVQDQVFWNCGLVEDLGVHNSELCNYCKKKYEKSNQLLNQSTILQQIETILNVEIKGEMETKMLMFLLMLSKNFPSKSGCDGWNVAGDPMSQNIILSSDSSSGKSWITKKVLELFGVKGKDYFIISRYTKSVLNYYTELNMDGKIVFIEELQGMDEVTEQLRVWMSEGELTLETVEKMKDEEGNEVNTKVTRTTIGQPVFVTNQAEGVIGDQLNNRSWVLSTDTSSEQTKHILDYQDKIHSGVIINSDERKREIQDAIKQLKPYHFLIPFSDNTVLNIPITDVRSRRDYNKFMTLIKCSAYLHQRQRKVVEKDNKRFLICDLKDYDIAKKYSDNILGATFSGLTEKQIDILNYIKKINWNEEFEVKDLMRGLGKTQPYWLGQLNQLCDLGFIFANKQGLGKTTLYGLNKEKAVNLINLPSSEELQELNADGVKKIEILGYKPIMAITTQIQIHTKPKRNKNLGVIGFEKIIDDDGEKKPIKKGPSTITRKIRRVSKFSGEADGVKFIGSDVIQFIKNKDTYFVNIQEIIEYFGDGCENMIEELKRAGDLIEIKPGKITVL